jgi:hypothetical protein
LKQAIQALFAPDQYAALHLVGRRIINYEKESEIDSKE